MVGYALSAASGDNCENILITVYDSEDFAFVDDGTDMILYTYSRISRSSVRIDDSGSDVETPYSVIYGVVNLMRNEERKWKFPVAIVWRVSENGKVELMSVEFQKIWPPVMFMTGLMEASYVNVTDSFFAAGVRPLYVSFLSDVMNLVLYKCGIYIPDAFCPCFNSLFCDYRVILLEKRFLKSDYLSKALPGICKDEIRKSDRVGLFQPVYKISRRRIKRNLKKVLKTGYSVCGERGMAGEMINIKKHCVMECLSLISDFCDGMITSENLLNSLRVCISDALGKITAMSSRLVSDYVLLRKTDIFYLTFNDLLSALSFADDKIDLKSVIKIIRQKNSIACKNKIPDAVLKNGEMLCQ